MGSNRTVLTKLIAETWRHGDIVKSDRSSNNSKMIIQVLNKLINLVCPLHNIELQEKQPRQTRMILLSVN